MATLIGNGSHARDIVATLPPGWVIEAHHKVCTATFGEDYIIGINDPRLRAEIADSIGWHDEPWVHPHTFIGPECRWGYGTHINYGVTMTRTTIGNHCTISPGVTVCGDVTIGDRVLIGAGAVICDRVAISDDATIAAGAVVLPKHFVPKGQTWAGIPAAPR